MASCLANFHDNRMSHQRTDALRFFFNNNNNNLLIYSALFNIPGDQKRITAINNLKLYKYLKSTITF